MLADQYYPNVSQLTFLVVEDDAFQRWTLEQMLLRAGAARVVCAGDGEAARETLERESFDVLVCDLDMPHMDGIELMRRIDGGAHAPAVILCSGHDEVLLSAVASVAQSLGIQVLDTIAKPVMFPKLLAAVATYLVGDVVARSAPPRSPLRSADALRDALHGGEISAWYQPKVDLFSGEIIGGEALARWTRRDGTTLLPAQFIPDFTHAGLMPELTHHILDLALAACAAWRRQGIQASASVNVDRATLARGSFVEEVAAAVVRHGLYPGNVILEVTESTAAPDSLHDVAALARLCMHGFGLSIDDFGTGYSSMLQLARVPFTELKIDRLFVQDACERPRCRALMRSCAEIAAELGIRSVAQGVETDGQWQLARELGCSSAQGWRFGKALPWAQFVALARRPRPSLP